MALLPFKHPFTGICSGPTGCGKSQLVKRIILNITKMMRPLPQRIVWYYAEYQADLEAALKHLVEFREGCPEMDEYNHNTVPTLIIIDDLMEDCGSELTKLFIRGSHHRNLSVWFLMQNFFHQTKGLRTTTLNTQYVIFFKNPRDKQQIKTLARQMYDKDYLTMVSAFAQATAEPHGYLLVDMRQETPDHLRLRTKIIPGENFELYTSKTYKADTIEITAE